MRIDPGDEWACNRLGEDAKWMLGAPHPPVFENSLFTFPTAAALADALAAEDENFVYQRGTNPTVDLVQLKLAALERGERAKCFGSGMGAISATLSSLLSAGDHVVVLGAIYGPTTQFLQYLEKFGISHTHVAGQDPAAIEDAMRPSTRLVYFESPSYLAFRLTDIADLVTRARAAGVYTVMDNTWSTPLLQKPLTYGVDLVVHSLSKYIGGHSDLVGGVVVGALDLVRPLAQVEYQLYGSVMSPHDAAKVVKGLRTLPLRLRAHGERALAVAAYLSAQPRVRSVNYPGLPGHPDHELGLRQMTGFSGLFSFELDTDDVDTLRRFVDGLEVFRIGVSWGGHESLVNAPVLTTRELVRRTMGVPTGLVRLSVGLESADVLIADLEKSFAAL